jgi:hypothetical protein
VSRLALDLLARVPSASDATALHVRLVAIHWHRTGWAFARDYSGMVVAGHTDLLRERFAAARRAFVQSGLLCIAARYVARRSSRTYELGCPLPTDANVAPLLRGGEKRKRVE